MVSGRAASRDSANILPPTLKTDTPSENGNSSVAPAKERHSLRSAAGVTRGTYPSDLARSVARPMTPPERRLLLAPCPTEAVARLETELGVSHVVAQVLVRR